MTVTLSIRKNAIPSAAIGAGKGHQDADNCVRAESGLAQTAFKIDQRPVHEASVVGRDDPGVTSRLGL